MLKSFYSQARILVLSALVSSIFFLAPAQSISAQATLAWDPNDPAPDGYRIYQRVEGQSYDYSQPSWSGPITTATVENLGDTVAHYFVVRAYVGTEESADSNEVSFLPAPPPATTYTITVNAGSNGTISPGSAVTVDQGGDQRFTIVPDSGYHIVDVVVDGMSKGAFTSYTFNQVSANHSINASFTVDTYSISASAGTNGSISPAGVVNINNGASQTYTITPEAGYHVADVRVDGLSRGSMTSFTFNQISANHSIQATFSNETYTVPQTTQATLAWDPNDPTPDGYRIYQRVDGQSYDYSQPIWTGSGTSGTIYNLNYDTTYYFVVRAYAGTDESADSEEVSYFPPSPESTTYSISSTAGQHGSISPGSTITVAEGSDQTFTISPDAGYHVAAVAVDGASMGSISAYTFSYVSANHTINASFALDTHIISSADGPNGSISPSGNVTVDHGSSQSCAIIPNAGYHVADVLVDGVSIGSVSSYTFNPVTENHAISATFSIDSHIISASAGNNGSITPAGSVKVDHGSSQAFSIMPNDGYHVEDVLVDGISIGAIGAFTFSDVSADHAIHATFAQDVIIVNQPPTADAGPNQTVEEAKEVRLSGSNSIDPDDGIASYQWRQTQGTDVVLNAPDQPETTFTAPDVDTAGASLVFELAVTDYQNVTTVDTCIVNVTWVNIPPTADAGGEQSVSEGILVTLDAANSVDPDDGIIEYHWQQTQGPAVTLSGSRSSVASFNAPDTGTEGVSLIFQLTVIDAGGLQDSDTCLVTVAWVNSPPLADAGPDQQVSIGDEVTLDGSLSTDADSDLIVSYRWRQTDGIPVELSDATAEKPSFEAPDVGNEGGILRFELTVKDSGGLLSKDTCEVVVDAPVEGEADTTPPQLTIGNPAGDSVTIRTFSIEMSGSARDDQGVEKVVWKNNRGGSGVAAGTTQWQIQNISLKYGTNVITITAIDASGNSTSISKTVVVLYRWWWWWS